MVSHLNRQTVCGCRGKPSPLDGRSYAVTDDIEWHYHVGSRPVIGVEAMRKMLERLKDHQLDVNWRVTRHSETEDGPLIEAVDDFKSPSGHRVQVPYMGAYRFEGELISSWRD